MHRVGTERLSGCNGMGEVSDKGMALKSHQSIQWARPELHTWAWGQEDEALCHVQTDILY